MKHRLEPEAEQTRAGTGARIRATLVTGLVVAGAMAFSAASCSPPSKSKKTLPGTWFGYLSYGQSTGGYNTMTIAKDKSCTLVGQVSGQSEGWGGAYTLLFQGEPNVLTSRILGNITITRQRPGIDTVQVSGYWSGDIVLDEESMHGIWVTDQGASFFAEGFWAATKQDEPGSGF